MSDTRQRITSIDWLRGLVMVLMVLDHVRDYFGDIRQSPTNLETTTLALFFTRWITHFCAPTFVFLAGVSAWLYGQKRGSKTQLSRFLWTRGLWLLLLEMTVVNFGWTHSLTMPARLFQVIGAIGVAMIVLAAMIHAPRWLTITLAVLIIAGHNLLDPIESQDLGSLAWVWNLLHDGVRKAGAIRAGPVFLLVAYPLLPWIGVMLAGYAFGPVMQLPHSKRRHTCVLGGCLMIAVFVLLRSTNLYGDPVAWQSQSGFAMSLVAFLNCEKYPPSLLFLLMTLGPALLLLAWADRTAKGMDQALITFGRVPFFFYIVHIFLITYAAKIYHWAIYGVGFNPVAAEFSGQPFPDWYGLSLGWVYVIWAATVVVLYPPCRRFAELKQQRDWRWLSYL